MIWSATMLQLWREVWHWTRRAAQLLSRHVANMLRHLQGFALGGGGSPTTFSAVCGGLMVLSHAGAAAVCRVRRGCDIHVVIVDRIHATRSNYASNLVGG